MELNVPDVPCMFTEVIQAMRVHGIEEGSRNGPVLALQEPITVTVRNPTRRVLFDEDRCANPFFHVMEFIWMMSGSNELEWIQQFNSRFSEYAEEDRKIHGAYGHRWRRHFEVDQLAEVVSSLIKDPTSRRMVLGMWDPKVDNNDELRDIPCNTHIYLRGINGALDMTVCNRSNDVVWAMTGANAVHMTLLQELLATASGLNVGSYRVFSNNAHLYINVHRELLNIPMEPQRIPMEPQPLTWDGYIEDFLTDCTSFVRGEFEEVTSEWLLGTALPMYKTYLEGASPHKIECPQWRIACVQWLHWKR